MRCPTRLARRSRGVDAIPCTAADDWLCEDDCASRVRARREPDSARGKREPEPESARPPSGRFEKDFRGLESARLPLIWGELGGDLGDFKVDARFSLRGVGVCFCKDLLLCFPWAGDDVLE